MRGKVIRKLKRCTSRFMVKNISTKHPAGRPQIITSSDRAVEISQRSVDCFFFSALHTSKRALAFQHLGCDVSGPPPSRTDAPPFPLGKNWLDFISCKTSGISLFVKLVLLNFTRKIKFRLRNYN